MVIIINKNLDLSCLCSSAARTSAKTEGQWFESTWGQLKPEFLFNK